VSFLAESVGRGPAPTMALALALIACVHVRIRGHRPGEYAECVDGFAAGSNGDGQVSAPAAKVALSPDDIHHVSVTHGYVRTETVPDSEGVPHMVFRRLSPPPGGSPWSGTRCDHAQRRLGGGGFRVRAVAVPGPRVAPARRRAAVAKRFGRRDRQVVGLPRPASRRRR